MALSFAERAWHGQGANLIRSLKIVAADDDPAIRYFYQKILPGLGHELLAVVDSGEGLIKACECQRPDIVVADIRMPGIDGIEAAEQLWLRFNLPVLLISAYHDYELLRRAQADPIFGYLVKPVEESDLEAALCVAMSRYEGFQQSLAEIKELRQTLVDRKTIERAKGIIMARAKLSEEQAVRKLEKLAFDRGKPIAEIARTVIEGDEIMLSS
jgi:two-component system, response regulator PdtaR